MNRKGLTVGLILLTSGLMVLVSCISGLSSGASPFQSEMPYRGIIIGSYWEQWSVWSGYQEFLEPKIFFIGIVRYDGPMNTHYYKFEVHYIHKICTSLIVESFQGIQKPHFLLGFCRFYVRDSRTILRQFSGEMHGFVLQSPGTENIYNIITLNVNGTGLYDTYTGLEHRATLGLLHYGHYIELREFNGTKTPFYISGSGLFYYYYMVPWGLHPWNVSM